MRKLIGAMCLATMVVGCGESTGPEDITETYHLYTVSGQSLPALFAETSFEKQEIMSGQFTLRADATFSTSIAIRTTAKPSGNVSTETQTRSGTYTVSGSTVRLAFGDYGGDVVDVVYTRDTLTVTAWGDGTVLQVVFVFRK